MTIGEFLGVSGFCLALAHVSWQVWFQHRQTRERIRAEIAWEPQPHLWVYNAGMIPVYLAGVELVIGTARKKIPFQAVIKMSALPNETVLLVMSSGNSPGKGHPRILWSGGLLMNSS